MDAIRERELPLAAGDQAPALAASYASCASWERSSSGSARDRAIAVDFEEPAADSGNHSLSAAQREEFCSRLEREWVTLQNWFEERDWIPDSSADLRAVVSHRFRISKALVPAWHGERGRMEFPAWRVAAGQAAIAHELTHICFPNGNRFLAEGLAIHVQAQIGGNPAFPNFGKDLHALARDALLAIAPEPPPQTVAAVSSHLAELDAIATPTPLTLRIGDRFYGKEPQGQLLIYSLVGSFVAFLIETRGLGRYRELYEQTPFNPPISDAGAPARWSRTYGLSLHDLEDEWKACIGSCEPR